MTNLPALFTCFEPMSASASSSFEHSDFFQLGRCCESICYAALRQRARPGLHCLHGLHSLHGFHCRH